MIMVKGFCSCSFQQLHQFQKNRKWLKVWRGIIFEDNDFSNNRIKYIFGKNSIYQVIILMEQIILTI